ncbi:decapping and exoribonuclease protein Rai1-like [Drosophila bipectinata]|uniref:decapping and exoribonuclease protein Rai1-like n=1 Tax=Drosophila bipectinata TaxID=42026 RepID=UPI0038B3CF5B
MEFSNIRLRSLLHFDPESHKFLPTSTIKYLRVPEDKEYPLDLTKNYETFVHRNNDYPGEFDMVQYYFEHVDKLAFIRQDFDIFCSRKVLLTLTTAKPRTSFTKDLSMEAFRFKGCIFLRILQENVEASARDSYSFKARQYLFSDEPGKLPDTNAPVDQRDQMYGMFSARIGKFRLLYSCEVVGVTNTEKLGDLTDPEELEKCSLTTVRVVKSYVKWRTSFRCPSWVLQTYFCGGNQLAVAKFEDNGCVSERIEVESVEDLLESHVRSNQTSFKQLNRFLEQIWQKLDEVDNPNVSLKLTLSGNEFVFDEAFKTDFLDFANQF